MREIRRSQEAQLEWESQENGREVFNTYGTNDRREIADTYVAGRNPGAPLEDMEPSSAAFRRGLNNTRPKSKTILRGCPCLAKTDSERENLKERIHPSLK